MLGENVFTREWDVLILLDTCRVDALRLIADEYDFLYDISSIYSVGGTSAEWMAATFTNKYSDEIHNTAYLANNGFTQLVFEQPSDEFLPNVPFCDWDVVESGDFGKVEHIWKYEKIDERGILGHKQGHIPPPICD
jgi:hypothetical protein